MTGLAGPLLWAVIAAAAVLFLVILCLCGLGIWRLVIRGRVLKALRAGSESADIRISPAFLFLFSPLASRLGKRYGPGAVRLMGMDRLWVEALSRKPKTRWLKPALGYAPASALAPGLRAAAEKNSLRAPFSAFLSSSKDPHIILKIASSVDGGILPGKETLSILSPFLPRIRELCGNQEGKIRFFAYQLLVHDPASQSLCVEGLGDSDQRIRIFLASHLPEAKPEALYQRLFSLLSSDPVRSVRSVAKGRILRDCPTQYRVSETGLNPEQAACLLENLIPGCQEDERIAVFFLSSDNLELRLPAALFLDTTGFLLSLFLKPVITDRGEIDRTHGLLSNALEVHANRFLSGLKDSANPGTLLVAAKLAQDFPGSVDLFPLSERIFRFFAGKGIAGPYEEIYHTLLAVLERDGDARSMGPLREELRARRGNGEEIAPLLASLPGRNGEIFAPVLLEFLRDPAFPRFDDLRNALTRIPVSAVLPEVLALLIGNRNDIHHKTRIETVKALAALKLPYCARIILENLHLLSSDEGKQAVSLIASHAPGELERHVLALLKTADATVRSSIISALPASGRKTFLPEIKRGLSDPDPSVRTSSAWALADYGESRLIPLLLPLMRDQSADVRNQAAFILASKGTNHGLLAVKKVLFDRNEVEPVKEAAISGLGRSRDPGSIPILMEKLGEDSELQDPLLEALMKKGDKKEVAAVMELYPVLPLGARKRFSALAADLNPVWEGNLLALLSEEHSSLRDPILSFLEGGKYTEKQISRLRHRDPKERKRAASTLAFLATQESYRGIILAARDSAAEVRAEAIGAVEALSPADRNRILTGLSEDPDRRVRKHTRWLMDRIASKEK